MAKRSKNALSPRARLALSIGAVCVAAYALFTWAEYARWPLPVKFPWKAAGSSGRTPDYSKASLEQLALGKVLGDASPIFGSYEYTQNDLATWMAAYSDKTKVVHMNIPGTHDAATWNYSESTARTLKPITNLVDDEIDIHPDHYRCQSRSIIDMLNSGIRAFDLRYASDVTNTTLVFWHGPALQSQGATVENVLYGFYKWLDDHPTEALFLSFQYEPARALGNVNSANEQRLLYDALTSPAAKKYILQNRGRFGTLGEARGKITLLRRFDLDLLPSKFEATIPGIHFIPTKWTVNGANISLAYNTSLPGTAADEGVAYIQDYYRPATPQRSSVEQNIQWKLNATLSHFRMAADPSLHPNALFWGFASSTNIGHNPPITPRMQALGGGKSASGSAGVNQKLVEFLKGMRGKRLGIVMFDFYEQPNDLVRTFLSL